MPDFQSYPLQNRVFFFFFCFRVEESNPYLLEDPVLNAIAKKHNRSPAQVALRYQLQRGVVVLAKSFNEQRIKENFQVQDKQCLCRELLWVPSSTCPCSSIPLSLSSECHVAGRLLASGSQV